ncbi:DUF3285 domain-containing protein [Phormidium sp. LEGE 05292]|uniref:DUF3285 domain-containing protein n=1 Tax=[Phormidium] sp. LEGE 05292 TaxID=767427 RepID=UPI001880CAAD|nr:DUF3285 domain-containing protein [Phormidium sp. LEGE 05292]MBE9227460.1 DUF3285 domain-containing protein [Phormidium sp. LEGE 05292]
MSNPISPTQPPENSPSETTTPPEGTTGEAQPSYVKLAMRNMVRKRGTSVKHFFLTTISLLGFLIGLSYLTR